ncbi:MAG: hypothetical protein QG608_3113 [Actinomycetota bacterium]|nr:hypothetical protein [Actinomycetota bacterium]
MSIRQETEGPYPFRSTDLSAESLQDGVAHTLKHFEGWRDANPALVAGHVEGYQEQLKEIRSKRSRFHWRGAERRATTREVIYFAAFNVGQVPGAATVEAVLSEGGGRVPTAADLVAGIDGCRGVREVVDRFTGNIPALRGLPETTWLIERFERLYRILPEPVVRAGGMGKAARAAAGVLALGAFDTLDTDPATRREHLRRILPGAYALGAAYVIVDDTFQDLPNSGIPREDRLWCHHAILDGLGTGEPIDTSGMPDHPLAEEIHDLYCLMLRDRPFDEHRSLYAAARAMYLAQHRDSVRTLPEVTASGGVRALYPDVFLKAGLSRVVANLLGRREPVDECWARCLNTVFPGQLKDDLRDREQDALAGRLTPFTLPPDRGGTNPLFDLFAYDAYVLHEVFGGDLGVEDALTHFGAVKLAGYLSAGPSRAAELLEQYETTTEVARFLRAASGIPPEVARRREPADTQLRRHCARALAHRDPTAVDARTFVADRLGHINEVIGRYVAERGTEGLHRIVAYTLDAPGKRLRPALGLMLAAELGVEATRVEPIVVACELFHTASLIFDDLPAQDNAAVRRGRATAHVVFDEGSVQLAGIAMISSGFGILARLGERYPAERVTQVIEYLGTVLGPERLCHGQDLDLRLGRPDGPEATGEEILRMYELKTSTSIEAALVPLMMLENRPEVEIETIRQYARHAGIVFQIRDDVLDLTSSTLALGKDAGNDVGKVNVVRAFGPEQAERIMQVSLDEALACCARLPFDTGLLEGIVVHFARRAR